MANYIAHYTKKQSILRRKEAELLRLIQRDQGELGIFRAALAVRDSRVRALKAHYETIPPHGENEQKLQAVKYRIRVCENTALESIVAEFRSQFENSTPPPAA